jgi:hypothetical protein
MNNLVKSLSVISIDNESNVEDNNVDTQKNGNYICINKIKY